MPRLSSGSSKRSRTAERFAHAYFRNGGNGTKAYLSIRPKVKRESAHVEASRLLRNPTVQAELERLRLELKERVPLETEALAQRLKTIAMGDITQVADWGGTVRMQVRDSALLSPEDAALIEEYSEEPTLGGFKRRVKIANRTAAARLLLELRGELVKNVKVEGEVLHRVVAMPSNLSRDEWASQYAPGKQVVAKVEKIEENDV